MKCNYVRILLDYLTKRKMFSHVHTYCMFIGYPRSGHSIIGSLLDAHPNMIIAHELDVLKYIKKGYSKRKIFCLLHKNSQEFAKQGRSWSGYSYTVPHQYQGIYSQLLVIGDKKGGTSTKRLRDNPELLDTLQRKMNMPVKFIHVYRNPYDNITTIAKLSGSAKNNSRKISDELIRKAITRYFSNVETVISLKNKLKDNVLDICQEDFVSHPKKHLKKICTFLGLTVTEDYLTDCAKIVFNKPHQSRYDFEWTPDLIQLVQEKSSTIPFLKDYSFSE